MAPTQKCSIRGGGQRHVAPTLGDLWGGGQSTSPAFDILIAFDVEWY